MLLVAQVPPAAPKKPAPAPAAPKPAREPGLYATINVSQGAAPLGKIVIKLYETESPVTVKNFTDLAMGRKSWKDPRTGAMVMKPLYNGLTFHRVIPGFMIQGGDPLGTGTGNVASIPDEFHPSLKFDVPGRVAMANAGPGTGSCQFFITEAPTPHLTGRHTIFGQVVEGQDLVEKIARVPRGGSDKPNVPVRMTSVIVKREPSAAPAVKKAVTPAKPAVKKAVPPAKPAAAKPAAVKPAVAKPAAVKPAVPTPEVK